MDMIPMLSCQIIGVGAAGNKAAITTIQDDVTDIENVLLINSTEKDIPEAFKQAGKYQVIGDGINGCGQEREKGKEIAINALQSGQLNLDEFIKPTTDIVAVITSTEGGTGSGASVVISKYIKDVLNKDVIVFAITGFCSAPRNIWNTISFFKDMEDTYHIEILSNMNFLSDCKNNQLKAEAACNAEIGRRIRVLTGQVIKPAEQNIDNRDLMKLVVEPGWTNTEYFEITDKIKNIAQFNDIINNILDNTKSMEPTATQKRLGVIINLSEKELDSIDYNFEEIVNRYGTPYEIFKHIEHIEATHFIAFISTGNKLPIEEFEELYDKYNKTTSNVDKSKDTFFDTIGGMTAVEEDNMFDMKDKSISAEQMAMNKNNFFSSFGKNTTATPMKTIPKEDVSPTQPTSIRKDMKNY